MLAVHETIRALAPERAPDEAVSRYLAERHPGLSKVSSRAASDKRTDNDKWRGFTAGDGVELNMGVGGQHAPMLIGR